MKEFYQSYTFILSFMGLEIAISMLFGEDFTLWFLYLVLFSMVLLNSETFVNFFDSTFFKYKKGN